MSHLMNTYGRLPVALSHGEGSWVTDTDGKLYLDAMSGIAVSTLGHNHPELVTAIAAQAGRLHLIVDDVAAAEAVADTKGARNPIGFISPKRET